MRASTSIWSQTVNRLFGTPRATAKRRRPGRRPSALGRGFERLEDRMVLSVSLGSVLSIGNDTGSSAANDVATDQAGNSYLTGSFSGTVDFDQAATHAGDADILTARGSGDAFVAKYAPDNSLVWVQRMGGDASDRGGKIAVDSSGSVYVVGNFLGSADFGSTTLSTAGDSDGFVAKLDAGGTVQWAKSWGTTANNGGGNGIGVDAAGNVYALDRWYDAVIAGARYDVLKFSPTGAAVWSKSIATRSVMPFADLAVDGSGNVFVAGSFRGIVDFDPSSNANYVSGGGSDAAFVLKLDTKGRFGWVSPFVGQVVDGVKGSSFANSVALDGSGNIVVGGTYSGAVDFNPGSGTTTLSGRGGFITKLNSSGGLVWARALESVGPTAVYGLAVDSAGAIYATGNFYGTVDLDPGAGSQIRTTAGSAAGAPPLTDADVFVVKLTATGNFDWAETFGGTGNDVGWGIAVDTTGAVHVAGYYRGTVDFDPDPLAIYNLINPGTFANGFRLRLRQV